jgi:hypothetical protein
MSLFILAGLIVAGGGLLLWEFVPDNVKPALAPSTAPPANPIGNASILTDSSAQVSRVFNQCTDPTSVDCCNGIDGLCDFGVHEILYGTLHNAMASRDAGFLPIAMNHDYNLEAALLYGYRGINLDIGLCDGEYKLFHGNCQYGT